jgi:type II secretory pathway pseudopilin PulG
MELLVVILFFSLSVSVLFRLFVSAYARQQESGRLDGALLAAQSMAERYRAAGLVMFADGETTYSETAFGGGSGANAGYRLETELTLERTVTGWFIHGTIKAYAAPVSDDEDSSNDENNSKDTSDTGGHAETEPLFVVDIGRYISSASMTATGSGVSK